MLAVLKKNENNNTENNDTISEVVEITADTTEIEEVIGEEKLNPREDGYVQFFEDHDLSDSVNAWLFASDVTLLVEAAEDFDNIKTAKQLADFYNNTINDIAKAVYGGISISNPEVIFAGDYAPVETWSFLHNYLPFVGVDLMCSECDAEVMADLFPLQAKAYETADTIDETFFNLLIDIYASGECEGDRQWEGGGNSGNWHTMDGCDFCSYSNLGTYQIYYILKQIIAIQKATNLFDEKLNSLKTLTLSYTDSYHYAGSMSDVIAELEDIKTLELSEQDIQKIDNVRAFIDATANEIQFNCQDGGCSYDY